MENMENTENKKIEPEELVSESVSTLYFFSGMFNAASTIFFIKNLAVMLNTHIIFDGIHGATFPEIEMWRNIIFIISTILFAGLIYFGMKKSKEINNYSYLATVMRQWAMGLFIVFVFEYFLGYKTSTVEDITILKK